MQYDAVWCSMRDWWYAVLWALPRRKVSSPIHPWSGASIHHWPLFTNGIFCWLPLISETECHPHPSWISLLTDFLGPQNRGEHCKAHVYSSTSHGDALTSECTLQFHPQSWQLSLLQELFENLAGLTERVFCLLAADLLKPWKWVCCCSPQPGQRAGAGILGAALQQVRILSLHPHPTLHQPAQFLPVMRMLNLQKTAGTNLHLS